MQREITFEYSRTLARKAFRHYMWRKAGGGFIGLAVFVLIGVVSIINGVSSPWFLVFAFGYPIVIVSLWIRGFKRVGDRCDKMPDPRVTVRIESETITFQTTEITSTLKWSLIKEIWRFPGLLLLFYGEGGKYSFLPTEPLGEELSHYVEDRVRQHGGVVDDGSEP